MKYALLLPALIGSLALSACDSEKSDKKAALENAADAKEKQADAVKDQAKAEGKMKEAQGEAAAKEMKKEADATRDEKAKQ